MRDGAPANLTRLDMGSHTGTHVDAPAHFIDGARTLDRIPIDRWMGRVRVVQTDAARIDVAALRKLDIDGARRLLFKTRNAGLLRDPVFHEDFVAIEPGAAKDLVRRGIELVGIDYLSIEPFGTQTFPTHKILLGADVLVVEGLDLARVVPGDYEMICLPMLVKGGDGAPARVALSPAA